MKIVCAKICDNNMTLGVIGFFGGRDVAEGMHLGDGGGQGRGLVALERCEKLEGMERERHIFPSQRGFSQWHKRLVQNVHWVSAHFPVF